MYRGCFQVQKKRRVSIQVTEREAEKSDKNPMTTKETTFIQLVKIEKEWNRKRRNSPLPPLLIAKHVGDVYSILNEMHIKAKRKCDENLIQNNF